METLGDDYYEKKKEKLRTEIRKGIICYQEKLKCKRFNPAGTCIFQRRIHFDSKGQKSLTCPCKNKK